MRSFFILSLLVTVAIGIPGTCVADGMGENPESHQDVIGVNTPIYIYDGERRAGRAYPHYPAYCRETGLAGDGVIPQGDTDLYMMSPSDTSNLNQMFVALFEHSSLMPLGQHRLAGIAAAISLVASAIQRYQAMEALKEIDPALFGDLFKNPRGCSTENFGHNW